jgi:hypothetical protein
MFIQTAKEWTEKHANPESIQSTKMKVLLDMGFEKTQAQVNTF